MTKNPLQNPSAALITQASLQYLNGSLIVTISPDILKTHQVSFYLYHNYVRVETQAYSKKTKVRFKCPAEIGTYHCIAYLKDDIDSTVFRLRSNNQPIKTRYSPSATIGQASNAAAVTIPAKNLPKLEYVSYFGTVMSGSYHDFKKNGFKARANYPAIHIRNPVRFDNIPDLNVEYLMNGWRFLNPIWNHYAATHDERLIHEVFSYMTDWDVYRLRSKKMYAVWNDMMTGIRAMHIALLTYIVSAHSVQLNAQQEKLLKKLQDVHLYKLSQGDWIKLTNHGMWQLLGLRLLCWSLQDKHTESLELCYTKLKDLLDFTFDEEGVNTENSPSYHIYSSKLINCLPKELFKASAHHISTITTNAHIISAWLTDPNGVFYAIGDTEGPGVLFPNNHQFADSEKKSNENILCKYYKQGYAIVRTTPETAKHRSQSLIFYATNKNVTHGHADKLGFILFHNGVEIFTDPGKYIYEYGSWRDYFVSDKAHNVLGIVGRIFTPHDVDLASTQLHSIDHSGSTYTISGRTFMKEDEFGYERILSYLPGKMLKITDKLLITPLNAIEQRFHLGIDIRAKLVENGKVILINNGNALGYLQVSHDAIAIEIINGAEDPITGWCSKDYKHKTQVDTIVITYPATSGIIETEVHFDAIGES